MGYIEQISSFSCLEESEFVWGDAYMCDSELWIHVRHTSRLENLAVSYTNTISGINYPELNVNGMFTQGEKYKQISDLCSRIIFYSGQQSDYCVQVSVQCPLGAVKEGRPSIESTTFFFPVTT
jgi:hypothetical protein